jgi:hypothetical protein
MPGSSLLRVWALGVIFSGLAWPALAQSDDQERGAGYNAIIDNIDLLVDNYTRFLVRKYDLTEEQNAYTKSLLRERSYEFLDQHEDELRALVDQMFDVRTGGEMTPQELIEWGQRVKPIYEEAKRLVIEGNNEWRDILTEEQKKIHDDDLKLMYQSFETTEDQLKRIVSGEMTVEEFRSPQAPHRASRPRPPRHPASRREPPLAQEPPPPPDEPTRLGPSASDVKAEPRAPVEPTSQSKARVVQPKGAREPPSRAVQPRTERGKDESERSTSTPHEPRPERGPAKATGEVPEGAWEKYVREFIEKYKLNDEQAQKANTVLEDCKSQRDRYLRGRQEQIEQLDKQIEELKNSKDKNKATHLAKLTDTRKKLMEPIDQIFEQQLKPRLERLPTRAQRRAAEAAAKKTRTKKPSKGSEKKDSTGGKDD